MLRDFRRNDGTIIQDFILAANQTYKSNPNAKRSFVEFEYTDEQLTEFKKCKFDVHYFINTYIKTVSIDSGIVPLILYDYQHELVDSFVKNRFNISLQCRQSGKTTTVAAFILWFGLFHSNKNIAVLANKASQAQGIISRITMMLEWLPNFLKPGMRALNKRKLSFDNGSDIFSAATSSASIRGDSVALLYIDEAAFIPNDIEFYESTYPVITSGKESRVIMSSTPKGARGLFYKLYTDSINKLNDYISTKVTWDHVPGRDENWKNETIRNTSEAQFLQEMECNFMGSQDTLIRSRILQELVYQLPVEDYEDLKIYEKPKENTKYVLVVDPSEGVDRDFSAFTVFDIEKIPYQVVAVYRNNSISPMILPTIIDNVAKTYNTALILCEINSIGHTVATTLYHDYEYENMVMVGSKNGRQVISEGSNIQPGIKTSTSVKAIGCSALKALIENRKLVVNDLDIISELGTFVAKGKSFEADKDCHDDSVATLFLFSWLTNQDFFKEYSEKDIRTNILNNDELLFESLVPFGIIPNMEEDSDPEYDYDSDGSVWESVWSQSHDDDNSNGLSFM